MTDRDLTFNPTPEPGEAAEEVLHQNGYTLSEEGAIFGLEAHDGVLLDDLVESRIEAQSVESGLRQFYVSLDGMADSNDLPHEFAHDLRVIQNAVEDRLKWVAEYRRALEALVNAYEEATTEVDAE